MIYSMYGARQTKQGKARVKEKTVDVPWQFLSEKLIFELIFFSKTFKKIKFSFYMEIFAM